MMPIDVEPDDPPFQPAPPPWTLTGRGFVVLYRRPDEPLLERWVPPSLRGSYVGGPAALMVVAYGDSGVGPYQELLFVPGRFRTGAGIRPMITRILVSTWASVANGRRNWAIPKEQAAFERTVDGRRERWTVTTDAGRLAELAFTSRGPRLPVTTRLLPGAWATVGQPRGETLVLTHLRARGRCRLARLAEARFDAEGFPDLGATRTLLVAAVDPFRMVFPAPRVVCRHSGAPVADRALP